MHARHAMVRNYFGTGMADHEEDESYDSGGESDVAGPD